jgi:RNA 3'-terminal phosphate cyclase (ATP)
VLKQEKVGEDSQRDVSRALAQMAAAIKIDGSHGEGGGQILRNACTYAAILGTNVRITNIRAGRKTPGLRPQHLVGLRLLEAASGGCLAEGNNVGSTEILFVCDKPNSLSDKKQEYVGDTQTAGSVCLLMQTILPFALFRGNDKKSRDGGNNDDDEVLRFILKGGTDAAFAPPLDYCQFVFLPMLRKWPSSEEHEIIDKTGIEEFEQAVDLSLVRRGFYPRGGGEVRLAVRRLSKALPLPPIRLTERGRITRIVVRAFAAGNCPPSTAETLSSTAQNLIASNPRYKTVPITIDLSREPEPSPYCDNTELGDKKNKRRRTPNSGCGILITAETDTGCVLGGSAVGSSKIPVAETARVATEEILEAMGGGGCVDDSLQDQLILYMALADGISEIITNSLTLHTQTAIWLASKMIPSVHFEVTKLGIGEHDAQCREGRDGRQTAQVDANCMDDGSGKKILGCHRIRCYGTGFHPSSSA